MKTYKRLSLRKNQRIQMADADRAENVSIPEVENLLMTGNVAQTENDGIHMRYFGGDGYLLLDQHLNRFLRGGFEKKGDGLKMTLILFTNNILFGQDYRRQVTYWLMSLIEDIKAFNSFPWGHYVFKMTLYYI
ncbi:hypothetical protein Ddye_008487 [Dipteronia dyeriana]|uniref:DUF1985 domain-containing protein n=1 Tax=Dipteronia dyeriana TaxID=168575 RepID=A0AAE0CLC9_9ROSI|nr:hypothetical protein Ddye_008487 [Dipteronia dyeriana]